MYKKLNIKSLVIIFAILLVLVIIVFYVDSKKGERTFRSNIVDIDTTKVTSIIIIQNQTGKNLLKFSGKVIYGKLNPGKKYLMLMKT